MKSIKLYSLGLLLFAAAVTSAQKPMPAGVSDDWYQKAMASIEKMEYGFRPSRSNQFIATNPKNQLSFTIQADGYQVQRMKSKGQAEWSADFRLTGIGRVNDLKRTRTGPVSVNSTELIYHTELADVQYINDNNGLRQNFIVRTKPQGEGSLTVAMQLNTSLEVAPANDNGLTLRDKISSQTKLVYDGLKAWDADHQELAARMEWNNETNTVALVVDDRNAVYPVTIDPLNRVPEWTTSADGVLPGLLTNLQLQVQALYGYTVAGLGDINGDGYDDVAVSAPGMADVVSGNGHLTAVGAVFIYLGSPSGLSTTPAKVLQPTTALDGALFGFSIDAGDITGDGKNDIIISAPMDRYQTQASGILGNTTVEVTAGKVYMYRSEDLFSSGNPTPFLQIRLQGAAYFSTGILNLLLSNVDVKPLFGYSVAVTNDLNGDNKADIVIGVPNYLGVDILSVQSGAAFVYYSNDLATTSPARLNTPDPTLLGILNLPIANTNGLLFGFSVDGAGDFNNDGKPDVVVGAPAGIDLSSLGGIFTGQFLGGSAYVFYNTGTAINSNSDVRLQANPSGLLSNAANLFGYDVKGARSASGIRTGNILVGAPNGAVLSNVLNGLRVKAGEVHVFKKRTGVTTGSFCSDQTISSPRSSSILSILAGRTIKVSLMFGSSIDNMLDVNCDNIGDIIVGEPLSTAVPLIGADVVGGAAYVYLGKPDGTYVATPLWDLHAEVSPLVGINATALLGYSVAGAGHVRGQSAGVRSLVGGPTNTLDFGIGLLNLGNTIGVTFDFVFDNNGLGKAYSFSYTSCNAPLPTTLLNFQGHPVSKTVALNWTSVTEINFGYYELQRSVDGIHFETIAIAFGKGLTTNDYSYIDKLPSLGVNYYRLKMVDIDKQFTYSNVINIRFDQKLAADVVVAPNPVQTDINIRMTGLEKGVYRIELQNAAGQTLMSRPVTVTQYMQTETIQRSAVMSNGIYLVNIYNDSNQRIKSIRVLVTM